MSGPMSGRSFGRLALAGFVVLLSVHAHGQTQEPTLAEDKGRASQPLDRSGPTSFSFEVATVKEAARSVDGHTHINYPVGGAFSAMNASVKMVITWAFDLPDSQVLQSPAWSASEHFDIDAKTDSVTDSVLRNMPPEQDRRLKREMVQRLLSERFSLKAHLENRKMDCYDLVLSKGGAKLSRSHGNGRSVGVSRMSLKGEDLPAAVIAEQLAQITGRVVVDRTRS